MHNVDLLLGVALQEGHPIQLECQGHLSLHLANVFSAPGLPYCGNHCAFQRQPDQRPICKYLGLAKTSVLPVMLLAVL